MYKYINIQMEKFQINVIYIYLCFIFIVPRESVESMKDPFLQDQSRLETVQFEFIDNRRGRTT